MSDTDKVCSVAAPVAGEVMRLEEVPDPVFSGGALGGGCGIKPEGECVVAPFSGTVTMTTPTDHAIGLTSDEGLELLIHVGVDTVEMAGEGFARLVEQGERVEAGDPILSFTRSSITGAGHDDVVIVVTPGYAGSKAAKPGPVAIGEEVLEVA